MINSRSLDDLHPALKRGALELVKRMGEKGYTKVGFSATYRDKEYQDYLYQQGRTRSGNIVTNAKGGQSIHNYRLAFDIFLNISGKEFSDDNFFSVAGKIWTEMGGEWGGSWVGFVDTPHMQFTNGLTLSMLQKGEKVPDNATMPWEKNKTEEDDEELVKRYDSLNDIPAWGKPTISKLIEKGIVQGDDKGKLNLTEDMIRLLVFNDRAGLYK